MNATCADCGVQISRRSHRCRQCAPKRARRGPTIRSLPERLWSRVEKRGKCLIWTGGVTRGGHGRIRRDQVNGSSKLVLTHVAAWELVFGPVPPGKELHHTCFTPACVRVSHLQALTHAEHMAAHAALQTTCVRGHQLDGWDRTTQRRFCRTCKRAWNRESKQRKKDRSNQHDRT